VREEKPKVCAITGPTACGKTELAIRLARKLPAEIVSCDSRKVFKGLDIGTAKPTPEERKGIRYHLIDVVEPGENFFVVDFKRLAQAKILEIFRRGNLPILEGGSGLYLASLTYSYKFIGSPPIRSLRNVLGKRFQKEGYENILPSMLEAFPEAEGKVDVRNPLRMIRFIEKTLVQSEPKKIKEILRQISAEEALDEVITAQELAKISNQKEQENSRFCVCGYILDVERRALWRRIRERTERIYASGLAEEVGRLLERGVSEDSQALSGLIYREAVRFVKGEISKDEAIRLTYIHTRQFAKRQETWNRHQFPQFKRIPYTTEEEKEKAFRKILAELEIMQRENQELFKAGGLPK